MPIDPDTDAIVLGLDLGGASMLRRLARRGFAVAGITDLRHELGLSSRYGAKIVCPDPLTDFAAWAALMTAVGAHCRKRPALLPTGGN